MQYSAINVKICNNSTEKNYTCAPEEEIVEFINRGPLTLNIYFQNSIINVQNYTTPLEFLYTGYIQKHKGIFNKNV